MAKSANLHNDAQAQVIEPIQTIKTSWMIGITVLIAIFYYLYSGKSAGMYQQDEAGHFTSMLTIWHAPEKILTNWAKPGYKVLYAVPALFGKQFVIFLNCLLAAFSGFFAYKAAEKKGVSTPVIAFALLVTQPLWVELSFRNYSEIPSAFLLSLGYYFWVSDKKLLAALVTSYITTIRQEFLPIAGLLGLYLLITKDWIAAFSMLIFPLGQHVWGWLTFDDPLFLYNQIFGQSADLKDIYPRKGFDHYLKTSIVIFGASAVTYLVGYMGLKAIDKKQPDWVLLTPILLYVLINCLFNWQEHPIGPSTGGNLRYLLFVSPLIAVAGAMAFDDLRQSEKPLYLIPVIAILGLIVMAYMNYKHNYIELTEEADSKPFVGVLISAVVLFLPLKGWTRVAAVSAICVLFVFLTVRPKKMSEEDKTCKLVAEWYMEQAATRDQKLLLVEHPMLYYYMGRSPYDFKLEPQTMTKDHIDKAPAGTLILWDSHYSYRAKRNQNQYDYQYMASQPERFKYLQEFIAPDQSFGILVFEKLKQ